MIDADGFRANVGIVICNKMGQKLRLQVRCIQGLALAISSRRLMTVGLCCQCAKNLDSEKIGRVAVPTGTGVIFARKFCLA